MSEITKSFYKYGSLKTKITSRNVLWCVQNFPTICEERKNIRSDFFKVSVLPNCLFYLALMFESDADVFTLYVYRCTHNSFSNKPSCFTADIAISYADLFNNLQFTKKFNMTQGMSFVSSSYYLPEIEDFCNGGNLHIDCSMTLTEKELSASQEVCERKYKVWSLRSVMSSNKTKELVEKCLEFEENNLSNRVIIEVEGEEFPINRAFLCQHYPVFSKKLGLFTLERQQKRLIVSDTRKEVVGEMINFIYTDFTSELSPRMYMELYAAADKYGLPKLKDRCSKILAPTLSHDLILDVLVLAHRHADNELKNTCIQFIIEKASNVLESEQFLSFIESECEITQSIILFLVKQNVK